MGWWIDPLGGDSNNPFAHFCPMPFSLTQDFFITPFFITKKPQTIWTEPSPSPPVLPEFVKYPVAECKFCTIFIFEHTDERLGNFILVYEAAYHHKSLGCIGILHKLTFIWKSLDLCWNQISQLISQSASYWRIFWTHANMTFVF